MHALQVKAARRRANQSFSTLTSRHRFEIHQPIRSRLIYTTLFIRLITFLLLIPYFMLWPDLRPFDFERLWRDQTPVSDFSELEQSAPEL